MSIAIIPARGGSKRIPLKNIKEFCGKPMITYAINAANGIRSFRIKFPKGSIRIFIILVNSFDLCVITAELFFFAMFRTMLVFLFLFLWIF